jgi:hypothetical protein
MPEDRLDRIERILDRVAKEQELFALEMHQLQDAQEKTDKQLKETDKYVKNLGKTVGELTGGWGKFVVGLSEPAIRKCLEDIGFEVYGIDSPPPRRINKKEYEVDLLSVASYNGMRVVLVFEVKSYINQQKFESFKERLKAFREFFFEYKDMPLIGGVAAVRFAKGVKEQAQSEGFYVFGVKEEVMKLLNPPDFKPKIFSPKRDTL